MIERQEKTRKLILILEKNEELKTSILISLKTANYDGIDNLENFYDYLDGLLTHIPTEKELMPSVREFYYLFSKSPNNILRTDLEFNSWVNDFVRTRGNFLDTKESTKNLESFIKCKDYRVEDYIKGPSGWQTYNQFLARQLKAGKRPITGLCDNGVIVSPTDSEYKGVWPITEQSTLVVKGVTYSIQALFGGSEFWPKFKGGIFTHSFLSITDYHRFHMPVAGMIKEVLHIPANTWVTEEKNSEGSIENIDDVGFQFEHTRGLIIIESAVGYVAVMPLGMGHISSVVLNLEKGDTLAKGEEFGFFGFGGSDIIMLFQANQIDLMAEKGKHYKYGEQIGKVINVNL